MATLDEKIKALAEFMEVDESQVEYKGSSPDYPDKWDEYEVDGETYTVMTEVEADDALYEDVDNFIDDVGISGFSPDFFNWICQNALDQDWFEEACEEDNRFYAEDIQSESGEIGANRLIDECLEADIISESKLDDDGNYEGDLDLVDKYTEYLNKKDAEEYNGDYVQWFIDVYGESELNNGVREGYVGASYDLQAIVDEIKSWDGYGNNLARYDGRENIQNDLYIFRQD